MNPSSCRHSTTTLPRDPFDLLAFAAVQRQPAHGQEVVKGHVADVGQRPDQHLRVAVLADDVGVDVGRIDAQKLAAQAYQDQERWTRMSIINTATSGKFSTDRTMLEYNAEIWNLKQLPAMPLA